MSPRTRGLTAEDKRRAWDLYAKLGSWARVASHFGMGVTTFRDRMGIVARSNYRQRHHSLIQSQSFDAKRREAALYDPHRDEPLIYDNEANAMVLGDPPRGRRELLEAHAERTAPPPTHPNAKPWHL
jgi:hypothetical protein